jgi:hypothetical protein
MSKTVCIYPQDATTDFLRPLCDHICTTFDAVEVGYDTSGDDDPLEVIYSKIKDAQTVFFLGHGMSTCLYASILDNVELFHKDNISMLEGKRLFLLACNSNQFVDKFKLTDSIGFGFLPTSKEDIERTKRYHKIDISTINILDVDCFKTALVQCLINTLSEEAMNDPHLLKERLLFNTSKEIVECLTNKQSTNFRVVADELYYMYKDMVIT